MEDFCETSELQKIIPRPPHVAKDRGPTVKTMLSACATIEFVQHLKRKERASSSNAGFAPTNVERVSDVAGGEGLIGIQRAFQVAGVRTTVASLWKVDDQATRKLMELFYTNLIQKKMSRLDALREAQLHLSLIHI